MMNAKKMTLVYICSPYSGDKETNLKNARRYSRFAVDSGAIPLAPHLLLPQFMSDETERELALQMDKELLLHCDELWMFGGLVSMGMGTEIQWAIYRHIPIRVFSDECNEIHFDDP